MSSLVGNLNFTFRLNFFLLFAGSLDREIDLVDMSVSRPSESNLIASGSLGRGRCQ